MKYNFSKIKLTDIEGKEFPNAQVHKIIANFLYHSAKTMDLVETARFINRGEEVELDKSEIEEIRDLVGDPKQSIFAYAKKAIFEYIDSVQEKEKNKHKKK